MRATASKAGNRLLHFRATNVQTIIWYTHLLANLKFSDVAGAFRASVSQQHKETTLPAPQGFLDKSVLDNKASLDPSANIPS